MITVRSAIVCVGIAIFGADASAQGRTPCPVAEPGALVVYGDIERPITLRSADLRTMPQGSIAAQSHDGTAATYSGPKLEDVLAGAKLPRGGALRGGEMLRYIVVEAADGYRAVFALAELDGAFRNETPILALAHDGKPLEVDDGPFQIIVPGEQRHARWVRQVACIRIARHQ